jgi:uncharacterized membrane protein
MSELNVSNAPQGKGLALAGFILALVGFIFAFWVPAAMALAFAATWPFYFWTVLCIASLVMCAMGMSKLGKSGGKKGLAVAGLVIAILATIVSLIISLFVGAVESNASGIQNELQNNIELQDAMNDLQNR